MESSLLTFEIELLLILPDASLSLAVSTTSISIPESLNSNSGCFIPKAADPIFSLKDKDF